MAIRFTCPACRTPYTVNDRSGGQVIDCQACGRPVRVPNVPEAIPMAGEPSPEAEAVDAEAPPVLEPILPPAAVVIYHSPRPVREHDPEPPHGRPARPRTGFQCPYCGTSAMPVWESKISLAGWLFFLFFLAFICIPLCWIGLLMKEHHSVCSRCGIRLD